MPIPATLSAIIGAAIICNDPIQKSCPQELKMLKLYEALPDDVQQKLLIYDLSLSQQIKDCSADWDETSSVFGDILCGDSKRSSCHKRNDLFRIIDKGILKTSIQCDKSNQEQEIRKITSARRTRKKYATAVDRMRSKSKNLTSRKK